MADEIRRVRTQAERADDDAAFAPGRVEPPTSGCYTVPGPPTEAVGEVRQCITDALADIAPYDPERTRFAHLFDPLPDPDIWMTTESIRPPRRRWWHRLTRRNP